jgi:hypothetical protein
VCPCDRYPTHLPGSGLQYRLFPAIQRSAAYKRNDADAPRRLIDAGDVLRLQRVFHREDDLASALGQREIAEVLLSAGVKGPVELAIDVAGASFGKRVHVFVRIDVVVGFRQRAIARGSFGTCLAERRSAS